MRLILAAAGLLLAHAAAAHEFTLGELSIGHPWARPAVTANGAAYFTIVNHGATADRLIGAGSAVAERAELHTHQVDAEGIARMRPVQAVEVAPGGTVAFAPGGLHVMLLGLSSPLQAGTSFPLTLRFEQAGTVDLQVAVEMQPSHGGEAAGAEQDSHGAAGHDAEGHGAAGHGSH
jgi:hypothetical protein